MDTPGGTASAAEGSILKGLPRPRDPRRGLSDPPHTFDDIRTQVAAASEDGGSLDPVRAAPRPTLRSLPDRSLEAAEPDDEITVEHRGATFFILPEPRTEAVEWAKLDIPDEAVRAAEPYLMSGEDIRWQPVLRRQTLDSDKLPIALT